MKPYILDLREEGCPMALLRAKRESRSLKTSTFIIQIRDAVSMQDIVRYFDKQGFFVQVEQTKSHFELTIDNKRAPQDA